MLVIFRAKLWVQLGIEDFKGKIRAKIGQNENGNSYSTNRVKIRQNEIDDF